jgi:hypothetical protein
VADEAVLNKIPKIIPKNPTLELLSKFLPVFRHKYLTYCTAVKVSSSNVMSLNREQVQIGILPS